MSTKNFFPLVKKIINCTLRAILWQKNSFLVEVNFKSKANFELTFFPYLTNRKSLRNCQKCLFHAHKSFSSYFFLCQPLPENLILDVNVYFYVEPSPFDWALSRKTRDSDLVIILPLHFQVCSEIFFTQRSITCVTLMF